jgi:SAM-dependent methyltransferase
MAHNEQLVDVRDLVASKSVAEHCRLAEEYFARLGDWNHHLAKPFGSFEEAPQLLVNLAVVLQGLDLCPGMTVLEFGAGTCWAARILTQLGCRVIACDVSPTALEIGRELYRRYPPLGDRPAPTFLLFDGQRLALADKSVDRIVCLDAFHHVPNAAETLGELGRVLAEGGIAGFAEPGPEHSKSAQSQFEMRTHGVVENDIDIHFLWAEAQRAGFTDIKLALFQVAPILLGLKQFEDFLRGGKTGKEYAESTRSFIANQRNFFLYKGEPRPRDSRYRQGLTALITMSPAAIVAVENEIIELHAVVTNNSKAIWLPGNAGLGAVMLGCHVYHADATVFRESYHWERLQPEDDRSIYPGETVGLKVRLPGLQRGRYLIDFDLVSSNVCWFAINGSQVARIEVEVR